MAKRSRIDLEDITDPDLLERAFWRAACGKRHRQETRLFSSRLGENLARLRAGILAGDLQLGAGRSFYVMTPKSGSFLLRLLPSVSSITR